MSRQIHIPSIELDSNLDFLYTMYTLTKNYREKENKYELIFWREFSEELLGNILTKLNAIWLQARIWKAGKISLDISENPLKLLKAWAEKEIDFMKPSISLEKLKEICTYLVLKKQDMQWNENDIVQITRDDLKSLWVLRDEMIEDIDDIGIWIKKIDFYELVFYYFYLDGVLSQIFIWYDKERLHDIHSEYAVVVNPNFELETTSITFTSKLDLSEDWEFTLNWVLVEKLSWKNQQSKLFKILYDARWGFVTNEDMREKLNIGRSSSKGSDEIIKNIKSKLSVKLRQYIENSTDIDWNKWYKLKI